MTVYMGSLEEDAFNQRMALSTVLRESQTQGARDNYIALCVAHCLAGLLARHTMEGNITWAEQHPVQGAPT